MSENLQRIAFSQSRAAEYLRLDTLTKMAGREVGDFPRVVVKELVDNALDAAETVGEAPEVVVVMDRDAGCFRFTVKDNGGGLPPDMVDRTLDFQSLTSDKALYRTPSRGQQGNALKTIVGMPHALGDKDPLVAIDACGIHHTIRLRLGAGDEIIPGYEMKAVANTDGTTVRVWLPENVRKFLGEGVYRDRIRALLRGYHLFNPHAKVTFFASVSGSDHGESDGHVGYEIEESHLPTNADYKKFMPTDLLVVHWFDVAAFARLIRNYVSHGEDMLLGEFFRKFRGFTSKKKSSAARERIPDARKLSDLSDDDITTLFVDMRSEVKEPSHNVLGSPLGQEHLVGSLRNLYGDGGRAWYKATKTHLNGAPAVIEAAVVETTSSGGLHTGLNHSPTYADPLSESYLHYYSSANEVEGWGIKGFLQEAKAIVPEYLRHEGTQGLAAAVHITAAAPTTTDRGKTRLSVEGEDFEDALAKTLWLVSKELYGEAKKRERDAAAAERDAERRARQDSRPKRINKAKACYQVIEEAYLFATGGEALPTTARDLYYAVRNRIDRFDYDADELDYSYFSQNILPTYQREVTALPLVEYEPRGILYEPHGGKEVRLGTRSVAEYNFPDYVYDKILYAEKNGRVGILQAAEVDTRHDMALIGGQGYASEAIRTLFQSAEEGQYQLFVLHDADPHGYGIARTLREETARMPGYSVDVIDIGLKLEDALALGKRPETFTRKVRLDAAVEAELTDVEREHFVGAKRRDGNGKPYWISKRVELNDLSSPQLVEYVEHKLKENDVRGKVVPPDEALAERRERMYREKVEGWVDNVIADMLATDALKKKMVEEFQDRFKLQGAKAWIKTGFKHDDTQSWREALKGTLQDAYDAKHKVGLEEAVREYVREIVGDE